MPTLRNQLKADSLLQLGRALRGLMPDSRTARALSYYLEGHGYYYKMWYDSAKAAFATFLRWPSKQLPEEIYEEAGRLAEQALEVAKIVQDSIQSRPKLLPASVNTGYEETFPRLTADGRKLFFTTTRPKRGSSSTKEGDEDIYWGQRDATGQWLPAQPIGDPSIHLNMMGQPFSLRMGNGYASGAAGLWMA